MKKSAMNKKTTKVASKTGNAVAKKSVKKKTSTDKPVAKKLVKKSVAESIEAKRVEFASHLIIEARAGTGKTTTLVEGLKLVIGEESKLTPSPQQKEVWDAMKEGPKPRTIGFAAFNKSIAEELSTRVPIGCDAKTIHGIGNKIIRDCFGFVRMDGFRVSNIIAEIEGKDIRELRRNNGNLVQSTEKLVSLCKLNLVDINEVECDKTILDNLASHYDIELNGDAEKVYDLVPKVLRRCLQVEVDGVMDFDDMIWLPIVLNLPATRYDLLLIDEAQDLNRCQQELVMKCGHRLIFCGDPKQAIYGFAGADSESMTRLERTLLETYRGVEKLYLTVTRRCGKNIVKEANKYVPDFEAFETNAEGVVTYRKMNGVPFATQTFNDNGNPSGTGVPLTDTGYRYMAKDGDMVICRTNAPLVSQCFAFIKEGRKATIRGRDIGQGLISTINKIKAKDLPDLIYKLSDWAEEQFKKENAKRNPNENKLIAIQDRKDCLEYFCEAPGVKTVEDVITSIETIFNDKTQTGIRMSSVHRAKGLEANRVFVLMPKESPMPHPMAKGEWQYGQEINLLYVAITRAIETLVFVS